MHTNTRLESLYRAEERIGQKLVNMELRNDEAMTSDDFPAWKAAYNALEATMERIQAEIDALQKH